MKISVLTTLLIAATLGTTLSTAVQADPRWDNDRYDRDYGRYNGYPEHHGRHGRHYHEDSYVVVDRPVVFYDQAPQVVYRDRVVVQQQPVYYQTAPVTYYTPSQTRYYSNTNPVGGVVGAVAGGVIGNQIGRGPGRAAATAAGAIIGGVIGSQY